MRLNTAIYLYRALLRECRHQLQRYGLESISLRAPINSMAGSFNAKAASGAAYQLETLQSLVPGLAVLPSEQQLPLTLSSIRQLIRDNFRANVAIYHQHDASGDSDSSMPSSQELNALDQGFSALRALPQQAYLEACSSRSETDGVVIEATSCFSPVDTFPRQAAGAAGGGEHWFKYRIRITNTRQYPIKVLGRGWVIQSHMNELEGFVRLTPENAIVGQMPTIPPGGCFEYVSCTPLRDALGPGRMEGHLMVAVLGPADGDDTQAGADRDLTELERVIMPVAPFRLQTMQMAAHAAAADHRQQQSSSSMASNSSSSDDTTAGEASSDGAAESVDESSSSSDEDSTKP